jgi:hypothetical protein
MTEHISEAVIDAALAGEAITILGRRYVPAETDRDYRQGWRDALSAAQKCGAHNDERPPPEYALCVREGDHTGMHDDFWHVWGDRDATREENRADAWAHRRAEEGVNDATR